MRRKNIKNILFTTAITTAMMFSITACNKNVSTLPETEEETAIEQFTENEITSSVEETMEVTTENETTSSVKETTTKSTEKATTTKATEQSTTKATEPTSNSSTEVTSTETATEPSTTVVAKEETTTVQPVTEQSTTQAPKVEEPTTPVQTEAPIEVPTQPPHTHSYTSAVTKTATCTEEGIVTYTCSCGFSYTESVPTLSHSFGEYVYNNDATTENDGTKTATCSVCGTTDTITAEGTKVVDTTHTHDYQVNDRGFTVCTICGEYPPLPTESCPYPVNTIIDNGDGTYCMYYVNSGRTENKFGISDGCVGNNAGNSFQTFCDKNYLTVMFDIYIGDYSEGCINWICAEPY